MEPQTPIEPSNSSLSFASLNRPSRLARYLAIFLFITLPFVGAFIGYQYATQTAVVVPEILVLQKEVTSKKPVTVLPGFMLEPTIKATETWPEQKVYVAGTYIDTAMGCSVLTQETILQYDYSFLLSVVPNLSTLIPEANMIIEVLQCYFGGFGATYYIYQPSDATIAPQVVKYERGECGTTTDCSPYGPASIINIGGAS